MGNYLKEFLMLFLAISLGFGVENLRQDGEERRMEKEFMTSLLEDLAEDSAKVVAGILVNQRKMAGFDSLLTGLFARPYSDSTLHTIYYLNRRWSGSNQSVRFSERTLKQLTSTGGYRLIQNREVASAVAHYQEQIAINKDQANTMTSVFQMQAREIGNRILAPQPMFGLTRETAYKLLDPNREIPPITASTDEINEYCNWLSNTLGTFHYFQAELEALRPQIADLMALLEKEYQLPHPNVKKP